MRRAEPHDDEQVEGVVAVHERRRLHRRREPWLRAAQPHAVVGQSSVKAQGWTLLPIWVGPQASCTTLGGTTKISSDGDTAFFQGIERGRRARRRGAEARVRVAGAPIYYDMEGYTRGGACSNVGAGLRRRVGAPTQRSRLPAAACTAACARASSTRRRRPRTDAARCRSTRSGSRRGTTRRTSSASVRRVRCRDSLWSNHQRVHQYMRRPQRGVRRRDHQHRHQRGRRPGRLAPKPSRRSDRYHWDPFGDVAQLARAPALQAGGRGFESHRLHPRVAGQRLRRHLRRADRSHDRGVLRTSIAQGEKPPRGCRIPLS